MSIKSINVKKDGGPIIVNVSCPRFPQSIIGIVFKYAADGTMEGKVGQFQTKSPNVTLGNPIEIDKKSFCIITQVLPYSDEIPTPYEIVITLTQGTTKLDSSVPDDNGTGTIADELINSQYNFSINIV